MCAHGSEELTFCADLSLALEIALVADDDYREVVLVLDAQDLLVEGGDFLERVAGGDGVHEQEAFAGSHVLFSHRTVTQIFSSKHDEKKERTRRGRLTRILPDQQYRGRRAALLRRR